MLNYLICCFTLLSHWPSYRWLSQSLFYKVIWGSEKSSDFPKVTWTINDRSGNLIQFYGDVKPVQFLKTTMLYCLPICWVSRAPDQLSHLQLLYKPWWRWKWLRPGPMPINLCLCSDLNAGLREGGHRPASQALTIPSLLHSYSRYLKRSRREIKVNFSPFGKIRLSLIYLN